jgi:peptidyl-prolyl cis-trans isomerase SurA
MAQADALREKIDHLLLLARANDLEIRVDAEIARIQANSGIADPEQIHQGMAARAGTTFEDWKRQRRDEELTRRVISQEVGSHTNISKEKIQPHYDQHQAEFVRQEKVFLCEILIPNGDGAKQKPAQRGGERPD